jgi:hypothetical protein
MIIIFFLATAHTRLWYQDGLSVRDFGNIVEIQGNLLKFLISRISVVLVELELKLLECKGR